MVTAALIGAAALVALSGCARVSEGEPLAEPMGSERATPTSVPVQPSGTTDPQSAPDQDSPGVLPTQRSPLPANVVACAPPSRPPVSVAAAIADAAAPRLTVGVPEGWSFTQGSGDVAVKMQGPHNMSASVTIAPTTLDPEAAFRDYTDKLMEKSSVSTVSILPAELCDYSGQKLMGTWSGDSPENSIEFFDRVIHVWTNAGDFLVGIHVEAPAGVDGFDAASRVITDDVELTIP